tara:strand:+ start:256 stop:633 length:378 start_codon:yes stop_codon:yes gene_type:complete
MNTREINIFSGSYATGSDGRITGSIIAAKWEIDPDDGKSIQFRIPSQSAHGGATDRIAFYISASGEIGVNTKTPSGPWQVSGSGKASLGKTRVTDDLEVQGHITGSGDISSSGYLYVAGLDGGTF